MLKSTHQARALLRLCGALSATLLLSVGCDRGVNSTQLPEPTATMSRPGPVLDQAALQARLDALQTANPDVQGFAVAVVTPEGELISAASGVAAPDGRAMTPATPVRLASITKTFVAAAILRLAEEGRLSLDDAIATRISAETGALLREDGYDPNAITIRHLLAHVGGLGDHFPTRAYQEMVLADPRRVWTAKEQLRVFIDVTDPVGPPGGQFYYSDPGYILLAEVIEGVSRAPFAKAVKSLTRVDALSLTPIWWEGETPPVDAVERAHQWLGEIDTYAIHGSFDAFGAAGVIASVEATAQFFAALFGGDIFEDPETLSLMTTAPGHHGDSPYRFGLYATEFAGHRVYGHGGFWGTDAMVAPELGLAMASVALSKSGLDALLTFEGEIVQLFADKEAQNAAEPETK